METNEQEPTAFEKVAAELQAERAAEQAATPSLGEALTAEGIEHTATPKPEGGTEAQEATGYDPEATDAFVAALGGEDRRIADAQAIQDEALRLGYTATEAKILAHNTSRKEARKVLDEKRAHLQSGPQAQSALPNVPPVELATPGPTQGASAEVAGRLDSSLDDEAAGAADSEILALRSELQAIKAQVQATAQVTMATQSERLRSEAMKAAEGMAGQYPQLLRDGQLDPAVANLARDLVTVQELKMQRGELAALDPAAALRDAAGAVYGSVQPGARQTSTATSGPDVTAPSGLAQGFPARKLTGADLAPLIAKINDEHRGNDAAATQAVRDLIAKKNAHNASLAG